MNNNGEELTKLNINWYPGHMEKTKKQILQDIKLIDVVIEILDARIPISSQNPDIKNMIGSKKKIIVLNKCDLSDQKENDKWVKYFEKKGIKAILTDSNLGKGMQNVIKAVELIMNEDRNLQQVKGRIGKSIRVLILGIPNVGKSSFINRIAKKSSTQVGNRPGVTKQKQWIRLSNNIELLDTPGVLWPKFQNEEIALNLAYVGTIKEDILEKTEIAFYLLKFLMNNYRQNLIIRYKIQENELEKLIKESYNENEKVVKLMELIGQKRGAITTGSKIDEEKIAGIIIEDFRKSKLGKITIEKVKEMEEV